MDLFLIDYFILSIFLEQGKTNKTSTLTSYDFREINLKPNTVYKRLVNLKSLMFVDYGLKSTNKKEFYITEKGIEVIEKFIKDKNNSLEKID